MYATSARCHMGPRAQPSARRAVSRISHHHGGKYSLHNSVGWHLRCNAVQDEEVWALVATGLTCHCVCVCVGTDRDSSTVGS